MQLQQQRGRLPSLKQQKMEQILWEDLLRHSRNYQSVRFLLSQPYLRSFPHTGELDLEATLSLPVPRAKYDISIRSTRKRRLCLSILFDMSKSISPTQRFLGLLFVLICIQNHNEITLSIFSTTALTIPHFPYDKRFLQPVLYSLPSEYTNLHAGLKRLQQTTHNDCDETIAVVISDCAPNYGPKIQKGDFYFSHLIFVSLNATKSTTSMQHLDPAKLLGLYSLTDIDVVLQSIQDYIAHISHATHS